MACGAGRTAWPEDIVLGVMMPLLATAGVVGATRVVGRVGLLTY